MKKNKQVIMGQKKYKKELARKQKVKNKKIDLTNDQINMGLANIEKLENRRVEAMNDYLKRNDFEIVEKSSKKSKGLATFKRDKELFILSKLNLSNKVVEDLWDEMQRFSWLYVITDQKTGKKWQIFQITFIEKTNEFKIIKMVDEKALLDSKK